MIYFSPSTLGFYHSDIHGPRTMVVIDPQWQHPTILVPDPEWVADDHPDEAVPLIVVPDPDAFAPTIEIPNPDCKIPPDAVEISAEQWADLQAGQQAGQALEADQDGNPVLVEPPITIPSSATASQVIVWLGRYSNANGNYLTQVVNYVATLPLGHPVRTAWEREPVFKRDAQAFQGIAQLLGLTQEQIDAGLVEANLIEF